jgi:DNA-directed RNA polymerase specialized sigma24 family protein
MIRSDSTSVREYGCSKLNARYTVKLVRVIESKQRGIDQSDALTIYLDAVMSIIRMIEENLAEADIATTNLEALLRNKVKFLIIDRYRKIHGRKSAREASDETTPRSRPVLVQIDDEDQPIQITDTELSPQDSMELREYREFILRHLSSKESGIFIDLTAGFTNAEIAQRNGLPNKNSAGVEIYNLRKKTRKIIENYRKKGNY